jgi:hypothetical protein
MDNLAVTYAMWKRWDEAEVVEARILELRLRMHGEQHTDTNTAIEHLAGTYARLQRLPEAGRLEEKIVHAKMKLYGEAHHETLTLRRILLQRKTGLSGGPRERHWRRRFFRFTLSRTATKVLR